MSFIRSFLSNGEFRKIKVASIRKHVSETVMIPRKHGVENEKSMRPNEQLVP
jgi:hypothetical protein